MRNKLGCCVDKAYGKGCTDETCMYLPEGTTCGDCAHFSRCKWLISAKEDHVSCDWFPRRFSAKGLERLRAAAELPD